MSGRPAPRAARTSGPTGHAVWSAGDRWATATRLVSLWLPVVLYMAAVFTVSGMERPPSTGGFSDKQSHVAAYAGLALLACRAVAGARLAALTAPRALLAVAIAGAFGATDEWHQSFVPGRSSELADLAADAIGAVIGAGGAWAWGIIRRIPRDLPSNGVS